MLIYKNNGTVYCYIHIPKNSGKFIRNKIKKTSHNIVLKKYWYVKNNFDMAHIPFMCNSKYISFLKGQQINYYTYTRNPYNRVISAFFYLNNKSNINDFKNWVKEDLTKYDFNTNFNSKIIHYYPQYMFICNSDFQINEVKFEKLETKYSSIKNYNLPDYFDLETIETINKIYKKDFELFNYKIMYTF
tara:strand:+ start:18188 stop:18751 length:564 start_codon:yes stop_codon:yes gene_type:complete